MKQILIGLLISASCLLANASILVEEIEQAISEQNQTHSVVIAAIESEEK